MDQNVEIKEEPVWVEGTDSMTSDNHELLSEKTHLKEETESELAEPGQTQVNTLKPFAYVKTEIIVEKHTDGQLVQCLKKEDGLENVAVLRNIPVETCDISCKALETGGEVCHLPPDTGEQPYHDNKYLDHLSSNSTERTFNSNEYTTTISMSDNDKQALSPPVISAHCCTVCGKAFCKKSYLKQHMLSHFGERIHSCDVCGRAFVHKSTMKTHKLTHSRKQVHRCDKCDTSFLRKSDLSRHMHTHSEERQERCLKCGSAFLFKSHLKRHMLIHSGERPHRCVVCGSAFLLKSNLKVHMLAHSDKRSFCCDECGNTFLRKSHLKGHILTHARERSLSSH